MRNKFITAMLFVLAPLFAGAQATPKVECTKTVNVPCAAPRHPVYRVQHRQLPQPAATPPVEVKIVPIPLQAPPAVHDDYMDKLLGQIAYTNALTANTNADVADANAKAYELNAETAKAEVAIDQAAQDTNQFRAETERGLATAQAKLWHTEGNVAKWGVAEGFFGDLTGMIGQKWGAERFTIDNGSSSTATGGASGPVNVSNVAQGGAGGKGGTGGSSSASAAGGQGGSVNGSGNSSNSNSNLSLNNNQSGASAGASSSSNAQQSQGQGQSTSQSQNQGQGQGQGQNQTANPSQSQSQVNQ